MVRTSFLQRLPPDVLDLLHEAGVQRSWSRRECIFRKDEPFSGLHFVLSGLVKLYRSNASGREQIVLLEGAGGVLTLVPLFDHGTQSVTAETLKSTTTLFVPVENFAQLYDQRDELREAVTLELARRLRLAQGLLETIALQPVTVRVATRLFELATIHEALDGAQPFRLLLSQDELARVLGASRESIARSLSELRTSGVIEQRGSQIRIADARALFEYSHLTGPEPATPLPSSI